MGKIGASVIAAAIVTFAALSTAEAQCTTCSPLSLPSGSLVGQDLGTARRSGWAVLAQASSGWVGFPRQLADNKQIETVESARFDLFLTTVQATALRQVGRESAVGVDAVAPFGWLASRTGAERRTELSFGDAEIKPRATTLVGRSLRLTGIAGAALPTGNYTARSGPGALGDSARALTIGRGVFWAIAEGEARFEPTRGLALTASTQGRVPLSEASDGFRWGPELRGNGEVEVRPWRMIGFAAGGEIQTRAAGSVIDPFLNERVASQNVGATIVSLTPAVRAQLDSGMFFSLSGRIPVYQDLTGLQFQQGPGVFAGIGYVFPVGAPASAPQDPQESSVKAGQAATATRVAFVVREYGAEWCTACKKLEPLLDASRAHRSDVKFERIDVTDWSQEELAKRVPGASALPVVEVLRGDGSLIARLEGEKAFSFGNHLPEKTQ
jgi:thiol-disulfide isomerase/thioredoxin